MTVTSEIRPAIGGTASELGALVPAPGQLAVASDTGETMVGDGSTTFAAGKAGGGGGGVTDHGALTGLADDDHTQYVLADGTRAFTGNIELTGTVDGRDLAVDGAKLDLIEASATADQTDGEIETAYNNQVDVISQAEAEAGVATTVRRWNAERVKQAIEALSGAGATVSSVFGRSGAVVAVSGDYDADEISETASNKIMTAAERTKLTGIETSATADQTGAEIKSAYEGEANAFTDAQFTKLAGIETAADVTDTANVTSAGALMDSEVDADIKTLTLPANTTISAFGATLVDDAAASNARTTLGVVIGTDVQAHSSVLDATTASFLTADESKLDAIEASADVTDTTNVTAAGALMDSEVDADIKTLTLPANTTISTFGASLVDDAAASNARTTLGLAIGTDVQSPAAVLTSVTGSLTTATHNENILVTSGNVTVPNASGDVGFNAIIIAGGAHTVTFNSTTSAAMAAGDVMTVVVQSTTVIKAVLTPAADQVSFS